MKRLSNRSRFARGQERVQLCGNIVLPSGNVALPSANVTLPSGNVILPSGTSILPSGNVTLTFGNVILPSGNVILPSGNVILTCGNVILSEAKDLHVGKPNSSLRREQRWFAGHDICAKLNFSVRGRHTASIFGRFYLNCSLLQASSGRV